MGGAINIGNWTPSAEFNIWADPLAASIMVNSGLKVGMIPLEVTHTAGVTEEIFKKLKDLNSNFAN
jgi:inosine-uridine nucleoside N-ribohydrolase